MATKKLQVLTGLLSEEKIQQLIAEQLSQFVVISDTEPDHGPCIWFDTSSMNDENTEPVVTLILDEDSDESEVLAFIDGIGYGVTNADAPVLADDGSTYTITIS